MTINDHYHEDYDLTRFRDTGAIDACTSDAHFCRHRAGHSFVEQHPRYLPLVEPVFDRIDAGALTLVTSPITLAECLVLPLRNEQADIAELFTALLTHGPHTDFVAVDQAIGALAAELRARHNLHLPDALQASVAIVSGCDAFLTNDPALKRVTALSVVVLDDLHQTIE